MGDDELQMERGMPARTWQSQPVDKKTKEASGCVDSISEVTESPGDCRAA